MASHVTITTEGRSGSVNYEEDGRIIPGWWEFAGGDALAIVNMGSTAQWEGAHAWAREHRGEILRFVADEVIRQKARGCKAEIDENSGWINILH